MRLPDGRKLGFAEFGDSTGRAILWFHGTPGARRQIPELARRLAHQRGIRLVGVERPGTGDSTPHLYGSFAEYPRDIRVLADSLGIDRFGLVGLSGGGPYVLACAAAMPERVVAGCVLGGVAPTKGEEAAEGGLVGLAAKFGPFFEALHAPLGHLFSGTITLLRPFASQAFDLYMRISPEGDREVFARPEMKEMFIDDLLDASRSGLRSFVCDVVQFTRPWGFDVRGIGVPIRFWHGDADHLVPLAHAEHLVSLVPDSDLKVRPGESHLGSLDAAEEIIDTILGHWPVPESDPA